MCVHEVHFLDNKKYPPHLFIDSEVCRFVTDVKGVYQNGNTIGAKTHRRSNEKQKYHFMAYIVGIKTR